ncbi:MAG: hypothetical protein AAB635_00050 [Patescibacteria group bacterium]
METAINKQNSSGCCGGETVKVANSEEAIDRIPVVVPPIEVEVPLGIVPVEIRHVAVAIDLSNGALCEKPSMAPSLDISIKYLRTVSNS